MTTPAPRTWVNPVGAPGAASTSWACPSRPRGSTWRRGRGGRVRLPLGGDGAQPHHARDPAAHRARDARVAPCRSRASRRARRGWPSACSTRACMAWSRRSRARRRSPNRCRGVPLPAARRRGSGSGLARDLAGAAAYFDSADESDDRRHRGGRAVEQCEEIAATRLDVLFVGTSDLSFSMGYRGRPDEPRLRQAINRVKDAARRHGKALGRPAPTSRRRGTSSTKDSPSSRRPPISASSSAGPGSSSSRSAGCPRLAIVRSTEVDSWRLQSPIVPARSAQTRWTVT